MPSPIIAPMQPDTRQAILATFDVFRAELDEHNDRRERLIKASRDITNLSKKAIFLLHRLVTTSIEADHQADFRAIARQGRERLIEIQALFAALKEEVQGERFWRYQRNVSPGLQEYIEALSFTHYLERGTLVTFQEVQETLTGSDGVPYFPVPLDDYLLGVSDLTGELMRYAITAISRRGGRNKAKEVSDFVRNCKADFEAFVPYVPYLSKKQDVTTESLLKVEDAAYAIAVRSSEYRGSEEMIEEMVSRHVYAVGMSGRQEQGEDGD